ncbi:MAG: APC family permease [Alteraurantiacibacter sp.]
MGSSKLSFNAAFAMAVGGMIGGGIFATMGVVISVAGKWAWASFLIGGIIALATAHSYSCLTRQLDKAGGAFAYLHDLGHDGIARMVAWALMLGYTLTVAVYGHTFGAYLAYAVGGPSWLPQAAALASIAILAGVNLLGAGESSVLEIVVVWGKLAILVVLAIIGLAHWNPAQLVASESSASGIGGAIIGAATVFMAYEGFQLLAYDYDEMENGQEVIGKVMITAILVTIAVYILVVLGTAMLVGGNAIVEQQEIALAEAGRAAAGTPGLVAVTIAAVFSTASAINATIFATARLGREAAEEDDMPAFFGKTDGEGVPYAGVLVIAVIASALAFFGALEQLVQGASFVFLAVFAIVNAIAYIRNIAQRPVAIVGCAGAVLAIVLLALHLAGIV